MSDVYDAGIEAERLSPAQNRVLRWLLTSDWSKLSDMTVTSAERAEIMALAARGLVEIKQYPRRTKKVRLRWLGAQIAILLFRRSLAERPGLTERQRVNRAQLLTQAEASFAVHAALAESSFGSERQEG